MILANLQYHRSNDFLYSQWQKNIHCWLFWKIFWVSYGGFLFAWSCTRSTFLVPFVSFVFSRLVPTRGNSLQGDGNLNWLVSRTWGIHGSRLHPSCINLDSPPPPRSNLWSYFFKMVCTNTIWAHHKSLGSIDSSLGKNHNRILTTDELPTKSQPREPIFAFFVPKS